MLNVRVLVIFLMVVAFQRNAALAASCAPAQLPAVFAGGRAFATPIVDSDARRLRLWIDSDGSGFLFDDVAARYHTIIVAGNTAGQRATLPQWSARATIPALTRPAIRAGPTESVTHGATLPILRRSDMAGDPIFDGLDGQLGASWLQNRSWTFDYVRGTLALRCDGMDPPHSKAEEIKLSYALDSSGKLAGGLQYPRLSATVDGRSFPTSLDTAASVALSHPGRARMKDQLPIVRATSFAMRSVVARWHAEHPEWRYDANAGSMPGVEAILVPSVSADKVRFRNVWFTTRPDDDVFEGDDVDLKLGPTAFCRSVITIDYVHKVAIVQAARAPVTRQPK